MIPYTTFEGDIFSLGFLHFKVWGTLAALGIAASSFLIIKTAQKKNLNMKKTYNLILLVIFSGIIGSRIGWILTESRNLAFLDYFALWRGGMIWSSGLLLSLISSYIYLKKNKLDILKYLDVFAIAVPLGHAIARIGCYLIGDHIGKLTNVPWAISLNGSTHPVVLYEIILLLSIFLVLYNLKDKNLEKGSLFAIYLLSYSLGRFVIDFFRTDPLYYGLTIAQYFCIIMFLTMIIFVSLRKLRKYKKI